MKSLICGMLLLVAGAAVACGQDCCDRCSRCGCEASCCKVCRRVPDVKKVPKVEYSCECEDFCVPGPSERCVTYDECGKKKYIYTPVCAEMRTRVKLVKKETMKEVPGYKWVVENVCSACAARCENTPSPSDAASRHEKSDVLQTGFAAPSSVFEEADAEERTSTFGSRLKADIGRVFGPVFGSKQTARQD